MIMEHVHEHSDKRREPPAGKADSMDPVCGMTVRDDSPHRVLYDGVEYRFCSEKCETKFRDSPARYTGDSEPPEARAGGEYTCPMHPDVRQQGPGSCPKCGMALEPAQPELASTRVEYTCPMHPEIIRDEPGSCPICGMALEPRTMAVEEGDSAELIDMRRR